MDSSLLIGGWIAAGLTLFMYSSLYKDNPFFRFGEHLYLGLSIGYMIVRVIYATFINTLYVPLVDDKNYWLIIPTVLGVSLYTRFFPKLVWISRITFAFIVGYGAGLGIPRVIAGGIFQQIEKIITPLGTQLSPFEYFSGILIVVGVFSVLIYFFFSWEHKGLVGGVSKVGIYFVMIAFGASFGYTVMGRMSLLIGRCYDLIDYSSPKYYFATIVLLGVIIGVLAIYEVALKKKEQTKA
jgi:hypothetical protein